MGVPEHNLSRNAGDGAASDLNDKYDGEEYVSKDQRADTRTTYWESDIDKHCEDPQYADQLRRALKRQEGQHVNTSEHRSRGQQNHTEDKRRVSLALATQLDMTDSQIERVLHLMTDVLDIDSFGPYNIQQVALAVINVVAREYGRWIEDEEMFKNLMRDCEVDNMEKIRSLRSLVRERVPSRS